MGGLEQLLEALRNDIDSTEKAIWDFSLGVVWAVRAILPPEYPGVDALVANFEAFVLAVVPYLQLADYFVDMRMLAYTTSLMMSIESSLLLWRLIKIARSNTVR